jgi:alpha-galactosidase
MCPAFGMCWDVRREGVNWGKFRRLTEEWRKIAPYYLGDFYPLSSYSLENDVWMVWQFDRPDLGEGVVQAFRRKESSIYESVRVKLRGLEPKARYLLENLDVPGRNEVTGRELMETGLLISLKECPAAGVIVYRKKSGEQ